MLGIQVSLAQNIKRPDSYNYSRGVEAIQNNNVEEALEYLNKELKDNLQKTEQTVTAKTAMLLQF